MGSTVQQPMFAQSGGYGPPPGNTPFSSVLVCANDSRYDANATTNLWALWFYPTLPARHTATATATDLRPLQSCPTLPARHPAAASVCSGTSSLYRSPYSCRFLMWCVEAAPPLHQSMSGTPGVPSMNPAFYGSQVTHPSSTGYPMASQGQVPSYGAPFSAFPGQPPGQQFQPPPGQHPSQQGPYAIGGLSAQGGAAQYGYTPAQFGYPPAQMNKPSKKLVSHQSPHPVGHSMQHSHSPPSTGYSTGLSPADYPRPGHLHLCCFYKQIT